MNELNISIINPYNGFEIPPTDIDESYWNDKVICPVAFESIIWRNTWKDGYEFESCPCNCFLPQKDYTTKTKKFSEIVRNENHAQFKKRILNGDFSLCENCRLYKTKESSFITFDQLVCYIGKYGKDAYNHLKHGTYIDFNHQPVLFLSLNQSCNLKCVTCRSDYISEQNMYSGEQVADIIDVVKNTECVTIGSDGETFIGDIYRKILSANLSGGKLNALSFFTNANLLNEKNWNIINENNIPLIKRIHISIDAATKETYEKIRLGGNWDLLNRNLLMLNEKKKRYGFKMQTTFTISKYNYNEVIEFVDFAIACGFDYVMFNFARPMLTNNNITDFMLDEETTNKITDVINDVIKNCKDIEVHLV